MVRDAVDTATAMEKLHATTTNYDDGYRVDRAKAMEPEEAGHRQAGDEGRAADHENHLLGDGDERVEYRSTSTTTEEALLIKNVNDQEDHREPQEKETARASRQEHRVDQEHNRRGQEYGIAQDNEGTTTKPRRHNPPILGTRSVQRTTTPQSQSQEDDPLDPVQERDQQHEVLDNNVDPPPFRVAGWVAPPRMQDHRKALALSAVGAYQWRDPYPVWTRVAFETNVLRLRLTLGSDKNEEKKDPQNKEKSSGTRMKDPEARQPPSTSTVAQGLPQQPTSRQYAGLDGTAFRIDQPSAEEADQTENEIKASPARKKLQHAGVERGRSKVGEINVRRVQLGETVTHVLLGPRHTTQTALDDLGSSLIARVEDLRSHAHLIRADANDREKNTQEEIAEGLLTEFADSRISGGPPRPSPQQEQTVAPSSQAVAVQQPEAVAVLEEIFRRQDQADLDQGSGVVASSEPANALTSVASGHSCRNIVPVAKMPYLLSPTTKSKREGKKSKTKTKTTDTSTSTRVVDGENGQELPHPDMHSVGLFVELVVHLFRTAYLTDLETWQAETWVPSGRDYTPCWRSRSSLVEAEAAKKAEAARVRSGPSASTSCSASKTAVPPDWNCPYRLLRPHTIRLLALDFLYNRAAKFAAATGGAARVVGDGLPPKKEATVGTGVQAVGNLFRGKSAEREADRFEHSKQDGHGTLRSSSSEDVLAHNHTEGQGRRRTTQYGGATSSGNSKPVVFSPLAIFQLLIVNFFEEYATMLRQLEENGVKHFYVHEKYPSNDKPAEAKSTLEIFESVVEALNPSRGPVLRQWPIHNLLGWAEVFSLPGVWV
ncbi:unnamed protein product [Amoebophrya sp. A25]|nr:unnamed protein product [Amoebophrya sp. A25]|eukprot:GSA25T00011107001.1